MYPSDWSLSEDSSDEETTISVQSDGTSFWTLMLFKSRPDPDNQAKVPVDLVTASASGLDPHISEAAALYQVERIARVRKIEPYTVNKLVLSHTERPTLGIFGQTRVNVLKLNLALDEISAAKAEHSREPADKK